jgi:nucleoside triphosphate diphosphatase
VGAVRRTERKNRRDPGASFRRLVELQARLRARGGCPWDRKQTHASLRPYLLEETYEVLEAIDARNDDKLASELGDLLLQVVFHAQLAREAGRFDVAEVIERIHAKMVRRHPHVFGAAKARTAGEVLKNWEQLKAEERRRENGAAEGSLLAGLPANIPALLEAYQLTRRAARIGFDWENIAGLLAKLEEEAEELQRELRATGRRAYARRKERRVAAGANEASARKRALGRAARAAERYPGARLEEEVGDLLFVAANIARFLGLDPEITLRKANRKFRRRFREMERLAGSEGRKLAEVEREELEALWERAKLSRVAGVSGAGARRRNPEPSRGIR